MGSLSRVADESDHHPDGHWKQRFATASATLDSIIELTTALGAYLEGSLSNVRRLEEVSRDLQDTISGLPAGEVKQQLEHHQTFIKEQLGSELINFSV